MNTSPKCRYSVLACQAVWKGRKGGEGIGVEVNGEGVVVEERRHPRLCDDPCGGRSSRSAQGLRNTDMSVWHSVSPLYKAKGNNA